MNSQIIKTNIPRLDEFLNGGIRPCTITTLWAAPGIDNAPFAYQALVNRLEDGDSCIYVNQSKASSTIEKEIEHYGWDVKPYIEDGRFIFLDAYSGLVNMKSTDKFVVENPRNVKSITESLKKILDEKKTKHAVVVYDSISTLIDHCGEKSLDEVNEWKKIFKEKISTGIFMFTEWPYEKYVLNKLKLLSDAIIQLKAIEEKVILREFFIVSKVNWNGKVKKGVSVPFKITAPGGVRIYIPKILITGAYNAGKSSFVHSASTRAVSVDRLGTTIALDHGHVEYAGFSVDLFGTPGQERFDPILELLGSESLGVIAIVDATNPSSLIRVKEMLEKSKSVGLPSVVVANKADLEGAMSIEEIRKRMKLPDEIPIIPTTAEDLSKVRDGEPTKLKKEQVYAALDALFKKIV
ncbi:MAG: GTP-binding protein [Candidatus Altiarchaeales archaeon]|nr:MAG: GTP-binding protein [Candidatus Altiarchaeales archaeon]